MSSAFNTLGCCLRDQCGGNRWQIFFSSALALLGGTFYALDPGGAQAWAIAIALFYSPASSLGLF